MDKCTNACAEEFLQLVPKLRGDIDRNLKEFTQKLSAQAGGVLDREGDREKAGA